MRTGKSSRTAQHNALFRALDARRPPSERVADDRLAILLLPLDFRLLAELARVGTFRRLIERFIDARWPGPRWGVVARTRLLDDAVSQALPDVDQLLILGTGLDTRSYRLPGTRTIRVFEVDHPATQAAKQGAIRRALGAMPDNVTLVPVVFGHDDLREALTRAGFVSNVSTLVLWEGVTNYLTAEAVDDTFRFVSSTVGPRSPVLFTYVHRGIVDRSSEFDGALESRTHVGRVGEPYTFGLDPAEVRTYLAERGIELVWDLAVPEAAARYYARETTRGYAYYHVVEARTN